jgi:hypothetical protein
VASLHGRGLPQREPGPTFGKIVDVNRLSVDDGTARDPTAVDQS